MRKIVCVLVAVVLCISCLVAFSEEAKVAEGEIVFRGIPWGSSAVDVREALESEGISCSSLGMDPSIIGALYCKDLVYEGWSGYSGITNYKFLMPNIEVGGYPLGAISLYYVYRPVDGRLVYEDENADFYAARYDFIAANEPEMFNDLKEKLTSVYGESNYQGGIEAIDAFFGISSRLFSGGSSDEQYAVWDSNGNCLVLYGIAYDKTAYPNAADTIKIFYFTLEGDEWIDDAIKAQKKSNEEKESEIYGNGETNGL